MKKLLKLLLVISSLFCVGASAQTTNPQTPAADSGGPEINFITKRVYDFERITVNSSATYHFQFRNTGNRPLLINEMHSAPNELSGPAHHLQITWPPKPVKPGKKGTIVVTVRAEDGAGSFRNEIYVTSNATEGDFPLLLVAGTIVPYSNVQEGPYKMETALGAAVGAFMVNNIKK